MKNWPVPILPLDSFVNMYEIHSHFMPNAPRNSCIWETLVNHKYLWKLKSKTPKSFSLNFNSTQTGCQSPQALLQDLRCSVFVHQLTCASCEWRNGSVGRFRLWLKGHQVGISLNSLANSQLQSSGPRHVNKRYHRLSDKCRIVFALTLLRSFAKIRLNKDSKSYDGKAICFKYFFRLFFFRFLEKMY